MDLAVVSAAVMLVSLVLYVLLDGFDLGVGALMLAAPTRDLRDRLAESIEPTWDGNETWLIMAGVSLLAAFPLAYSVLLPALYIPLIAMLLGLGFRAVAFDFRRQEGPMQDFWDRAFAFGSIIAAFAQGVALGALLQGIPVEGDQLAGEPAALLRPLPILTGLAVLCAYASLGGAWAIWRLPLSDAAFIRMHLRRGLAAATLLGIAIVAFAASEQPALIARWSTRPALSIGLFIVLAAMIAGLWRSTSRQTDLSPFLWALGGAAAALAGLVVVIAPDVVPFRIDIWHAAAPRSAQAFYLVGACCVIPVILAYTAFAYWTFRGKIERQTR